MTEFHHPQVDEKCFVRVKK